MWYLFLQIWVWLVAAFALGWFTHWFLCCRGAGQENESQSNPLSDRPMNDFNQAKVVDTSSPVEAGLNLIDDSWKPQSFIDGPEQIDDLKLIKGVGAVLEKTLNELGIYQFTQIAQWNNENTVWVDNFLSFSGRIDRENWISQAKTLSSGGTTEFADKVAKGGVDYD